jgi:hypothetical protein
MSGRASNGPSAPYVTTLIARTTAKKTTLVQIVASGYPPRDRRCAGGSDPGRLRYP